MTPKTGATISRHSLVQRILLAMLLGAVLGQLAREVSTRNLASLPTSLAEALNYVAANLPQALGTAGGLVVNFIKGLAGPLLFLAVVDAFLKTSVEGRAAGRMIRISAINAMFALAIGLLLSNLLRPGDYLNLTETRAIAGSATGGFEPRKINFLGDLIGFVPTNAIQPFVENSILSIVILAVLAGAALRAVKNEQIKAGADDYLSIERMVATLYRSVEIALGWIIRLIPLAVFGVVTRTVAKDGFGPFRGLIMYVAVAILGLLIQVAIIYQGWILLVAKKSLRWFWVGAREAVAYAMGASSSLATLPVTLRCLDRMGVSPASARLAACVGTNLNNDGILLYEAMAVLFVAQVEGIDLTLPQQLVAALSCVIAGIGIAGIPEAGLISLSLVLTTVGLPLDILPLLLTVDWVLSRARAMTNVTSDILVAVILDRFASAEKGSQYQVDMAPPVSHSAV
jgi:Na+/H+-dicarboxylate symporter